MLHLLGNIIYLVSGGFFIALLMTIGVVILFPLIFWSSSGEKRALAGLPFAIVFSRTRERT